MRDDGNGRPPLDQDDTVRVPVELLAEPGITFAIIRVYGAIRSHVGFEPCAENFLIAWLCVATIAAEARVHRSTAAEAIGWLHDRDYLHRDERPGRSSVMLIIVRRAEFKEAAKLRGNARHEGRATALRTYRAWMAEMAEESRRAQARAAGTRNARQERASGRVSPGDDTPGEVSPGGEGGYRREARGGIAARRPRTVDQGTVDQGTVVRRGGAPLAPFPSREPEPGNGDVEIARAEAGKQDLVDVRAPGVTLEETRGDREAQQQLYGENTEKLRLMLRNGPKVMPSMSGRRERPR